MIRRPAVSGQFYPSDRTALSSMVDRLIGSASVDGKLAQKAVSYVAPHAGYIYSGATQAFTYKALSMKKDLDTLDTFVVVGPNHTGLGYPISISESYWETPLGIVENDLDLTFAISEGSEYITIDEDAHLSEHSIEVQLPFLQRVTMRPRCCFICIGDQSMDSCRIISKAIESAAKRLKRNITVIASSDFNHYESAEVAKGKDMPAIDSLLKLDYIGFGRKIADLKDSACGHGAVAVSAMFAKDRGAKNGQLLKYSNSGEVTKDYRSVVSYSSILFA